MHARGISALHHCNKTNSKNQIKSLKNCEEAVLSHRNPKVWTQLCGSWFSSRGGICQVWLQFAQCSKCTDPYNTNPSFPQEMFNLRRMYYIVQKQVQKTSPTLSQISPVQLPHWKGIVALDCALQAISSPMMVRHNLDVWKGSVFSTCLKKENKK